MVMHGLRALNYVLALVIRMEYSTPLLGSEPGGWDTGSLVDLVAFFTAWIRAGRPGSRETGEYRHRPLLFPTKGGAVGRSRRYSVNAPSSLIPLIECGWVLDGAD